jgi:hypothetical protein
LYKTWQGFTRLVAIALSGFESRHISEKKNQKTSKVQHIPEMKNLLVPTYGIEVFLLPVSIPVDFVPANSIEPSQWDITH